MIGGSIDDKAKYPTRHHRFRLKMAEAGFRLGQITGSHPGYVPKFELNFWVGVNGKLFITQVWEDGGYSVFYPTEYHQLDECEAEAIRFGTEPETPARELYAALHGVMNIGSDLAIKTAHAMLQKHLGLTSQKP